MGVEGEGASSCHRDPTREGHVPPSATRRRRNNGVVAVVAQPLCCGAVGRTAHRTTHHVLLTAHVVAQPPCGDAVERVGWRRGIGTHLGRQLVPVGGVWWWWCGGVGSGGGGGTRVTRPARTPRKLGIPAAPLLKSTNRSGPAVAPRSTPPP